MFNRHLRAPGLVFTSPNGIMSSSPKSSSSLKPEEIQSLVSDVEDEMFTTPPTQPSPNNTKQKEQDVRFYVESVAENQVIVIMTTLRSFFIRMLLYAQNTKTRSGLKFSQISFALPN